jgi:hypothetical protein
MNLAGTWKTKPPSWAWGKHVFGWLKWPDLPRAGTALGSACLDLAAHIKTRTALPGGLLGTL